MNLDDDQSRQVVSLPPGEAAVFADHLQEPGGVVAEVAFGGLVDLHHGLVELPFGLAH